MALQEVAQLLLGFAPTQQLCDTFQGESPVEIVVLHVIRLIERVELQDLLWRD